MNIITYSIRSLLRGAFVTPSSEECSRSEVIFPQRGKKKDKLRPDVRTKIVHKMMLVVLLIVSSPIWLPGVMLLLKSLIMAVAG